MTDAVFVIQRARVTREPKIRQVGDKELVTLSVAVNPFGKAKERFATMFVDLTFTGKLGERAAALGKGAKVATSGALMLREYEYNGENRFQHEIPYPNGLIVLDEGEQASPDPEATADIGAESAKGDFDF